MTHLVLKTPILALIFTMIVVNAISLSSCAENIVPTNLRVLSTKDLSTLAFEEAKKWRADAFLFDVALWSYPVDKSNSLRAYYDFQSKSEPVWLSVIFTEIDSGLEIETREGDYSEAIEMFGQVPTKYNLDIDNISLDSQDALNILYENGGIEFYRRYHEASLPLVLKLENDDSDTLVNPQWRLILDTGTTVWYLRLKAITNQLLEPMVFEDE